MKSLVSFFVIMLSALLPSLTSAQTGNPYYPMNSGSTIVYQGYDIEGQWDENTMQLTVTRRTPWNRLVSINYSQTTCPLYFGSGTLFVADHMDGGASSGLLMDGGAVSSNGITYMGEAVNQHGQVHVPFIPKLAFNPIAGQEIHAVSSVTRSCTDTTHMLNLPWRYKTIGNYRSWGPFQDVWRTGLHEYGTEQFVYNYVFARNKGMVNYWYGQLMPNGSIVNGKEFYAVRY
ncbi:hypothetical protein [Acidovorax sp.]|uniref:hypothetical protein n=1 Tax=Acidovorax sp. TaxID=1872122 RepID=UPI00391F86ED